MRCFKDQDFDAIGTCRICCKGLCSDCAVDLGYAIVCKGECEKEAEALQTQVLENRAIIASGRSSQYLMPLFFAFMGLSIISINVYRQGWHLSPMIVFGFGVLVFSSYMFIVYRRGDQAKYRKGK